MMFAREMQLVIVNLICPGSPTALFVTNVGGSFASHSFEWFAFSGSLKAKPGPNVVQDEMTRMVPCITYRNIVVF
jgi:hypothetical protein